MALFAPSPDFEHGEIPAVGVLVTNLGTPDEPTAPALRRYLREFLSDPRVIELSRAYWLPILNLFVLTTRPKESAKLYRSVWTEEGSPLLVITRKQAAGIAERLDERVGSPVHVAAGMRYGNPSIASALAELREKGCRRILVLPLYPQYSASTTASTFDALAAELTTWRWIPDLRTVHSYHDRPAYVRALAASIREVWEADGRRPEKLLFSYHGIPKRYFEAGDPYHCLCHKTTRLVAEELDLPESSYLTAFQSLFGREEWLKPYTAETVAAMAGSGVKSLDIICPGFSADCLETLEEIDEQNREIFMEHGGEQFRYIPALNDRGDHLEALTELVMENLAGWVAPAGARDASRDEARARAEAEASRRRADELAAHPPEADAGFGNGA